MGPVMRCAEEVKFTLAVHEQIAHHQHTENRLELPLKLQEAHYIRHALGQGKECSTILLLVHNSCTWPQQ